MPDPLKNRRYPGRTRVISRDDARDHLFRQRTGQGESPHPCSNPYPIFSIGLPSQFERDRTPLPVELEARCRKCDACLAHRRRLWTARAVDEINAGNRSWFGTLTINPHWRFVAKVSTQSDLKRRGTLWDALEPDEQFNELVGFHGKEITKFLKRVRKASGQPLRYLLVSEKHKSGDPHFHLLLHEPRGEVRKAVLESKWRFGFSHWRLVDRDTRASVYACKYLNKSAQTRVRASLRYGRPQAVAALTERAEKARDALSRQKEVESGENPPVQKR